MALDFMNIYILVDIATHITYTRKVDGLIIAQLIRLQTRWLTVSSLCDALAVFIIFKGSEMNQDSGSAAL